MRCLADDQIFDFLKGRLSVSQIASIEEHINHCPDCRSVVAEAAKYFFQHSSEAVAGQPEPPPSEAITQLERRAPPAAMPSVQIGSLVGRYVVTALTGSGGMGMVYVARDPDLHRKVALKLLRPEITAQHRLGDSHDRMLREARAMARLSHPNVVAVHDVGTFEGQVFVAMEFVEGKTLRRWLAQTERRSWREVVWIFVSAGKGLAAAHQRGLVHRDFKPENVLIGEDGRVRVTDFGMARPAEDPVEAARNAPCDPTDPGAWCGTALTETGAVVGTPRYMAPEQFLRQPTDPRTDQFSFCVALYEGIYGVTPFAGETLEELASAVVGGQVRDPPPGSSVPAWLRSVVLRGLRPAPEERYPSMDDLLAMLSGALGAAPARERGKFVGPRARRNLVLGLSGFAALAACLAAVLWLRNHSARDVRSSSAPAVISAAPAIPPAPPISPAPPASPAPASNDAQPRVGSRAAHASSLEHKKTRRHKPRHIESAPHVAATPDRYGNNLKDPFGDGKR